jgi:hypothetical protein
MADVHVVKASGGWVTKRGGQSGSVHRTQAEAVAAARRSALEAGGAEVVIHRADGRIRSRDSVGAAKIDERKVGGRDSSSSVTPSRAPRSEGPRTTLRLTKFLESVADQLAEDLGVSRNDALLRLATRGARLYEQEQSIAQRREDRWIAVVPDLVDLDRTEFPPPEEARDAVFSARADTTAQST